MSIESFGTVKIINGKLNSKFPYNRSVFIDDGVKAIIDPGSGRDIFIDLLSKNKVKYLFNTHYHYDHIHYNYLFYRSKVFINKIEAKCFIDPSNIVKNVGIYDVWGQKAIDDWLYYTRQVNAEKTPFSPSRNHAWFLSTCRLNGTYEYNEPWKLGETEFQFIHAPGHSEGFCCIHFLNEDLIYTGDIDLTFFGPWIGGNDSDIDKFIESARKISKLEAKNYATGHEIGTVSHEDFCEKLEIYLNKIVETEEQILKIIERESKSIDEITDIGLIYGGPKYLVDPWVYAWEKVTILKYLKRMEKNKKIILNDSHYELL